jgi:hypothetical protein
MVYDKNRSNVAYFDTWEQVAKELFLRYVHKRAKSLGANDVYGLIKAIERANTKVKDIGMNMHLKVSKAIEEAGVDTVPGKPQIPKCPVADEGEV